MPYLDIKGYEGIAVTRVTEPLGSEYRAWLDQNHPQKWDRPKRIDFSTIRGTSVHIKVEDFICMREMIPRPPKKERDPIELEVIRQEMEKPYHEQIIAPQIKRCFVNFLKYWALLKAQHQAEILYVECRVFSEIYVIGGTVDIVMKICVKGIWYLAVLDWKSGSFFSDKYGLQCSAYREFIIEMAERGDISLPELEWYDKNFVVLLGGSQPTEYQLPHDFKGYLKRVEKYKNPKKQCTSKTCVFCPDIQRCPFIDPEKKEKYLKRLGYKPKISESA